MTTKGKASTKKQATPTKKSTPGPTKTTTGKMTTKTKTGTASVEIVALDGKTFDVRLEDAEGVQQDGKLVFNRGQLESTIHRNTGFSPAACKTRLVNTQTHFEARSDSPKDGSIDWSGDVAGDKLTGRLVWKRSSGKVFEQRFDGRLSH